MYDAPSESPKDAAAQQNPYWPIGVLAEARKQFNEQDFQKVVALLHPAVADQTASPAAVALYGRAAVESQNTAAFQWWLSQTDDQTRELSDYWAAVGAHLLDERRFEEATRALAEAIDRDPTDLASMSRIRKSLATLGKDDMAKLWVDRWTAVYDLVVANNRVSSSQPPNTDAIAEMVAMMSGLDRPLEALLWKSLQIHYEHAPRSEMEALNAQRKTLLASGQPFPNQQSRLCGLDINAYPIRKLAVSTKSAPQFAQNENEKAAPAQFANVAASVGFDHTFRVESKPIKQHFSIYQTLGGGVAVVDYDLDGACDLYLAQGGADPPSFAGTISNQLFRHEDDSLTNRTAEAAAVETQYSIGVTAGDWNQDGFPRFGNFKYRHQHVNDQQR